MESGCAYDHIEVQQVPRPLLPDRTESCDLLIDAGPIAFLAHSPLRSPEVSAIVMGTWGPIPPQQQRQQQQGYDCLLRCMSRDDPQQQHGFGALCSADFVVCPGMFSRPQCATPIAL